MVLETHNEALKLHFDEINKSADSDYADKINIS